MIDIENPYHSPAAAEVGCSQDRNGAFETRAMRYATIGAIAGLGFGIAILVRTLKVAYDHSSPGTDSSAIDYVSPLLAFGFWSITTAAVLSIVGGSVGLLADILWPIRDLEVGEPRDGATSPD